MCLVFKAAVAKGNWPNVTCSVVYLENVRWRIKFPSTFKVKREKEPWHMAFYRECSLNHATAHVADGVERLLHTVWFGWPWKRAKSGYFAWNIMAHLYTISDISIDTKSIHLVDVQDSRVVPWIFMIFLSKSMGISVQPPSAQWRGGTVKSRP